MAPVADSDGEPRKIIAEKVENLNGYAYPEAVMAGWDWKPA